VHDLIEKEKLGICKKSFSERAGVVSLHAAPRQRDMKKQNEEREREEGGEEFDNRMIRL
jgi:hypothetical protein